MLYSVISGSSGFAEGIFNRVSFFPGNTDALCKSLHIDSKTCAGWRVSSHNSWHVVQLSLYIIPSHDEMLGPLGQFRSNGGLSCFVPVHVWCVRCPPCLSTPFSQSAQATIEALKITRTKFVELGLNEKLEFAKRGAVGGGAAADAEVQPAGFGAP